MKETNIIKKELRTDIKAMRRNMNKQYRKILDNNIYINLVESKVFKNAEKILIYMSTEIEVGTEKIIEYCLENKIKTAIPKCFENHTMKFYMYNNNVRLEKSAFGIYEPCADKLYEVDDFTNTICIVPALACDKRGYRLGYGGGFYDRFLAAHSEIIPVIICYSENITEKLIHDEFDRKALFVVSEKGLEVCYGQ